MEPPRESMLEGMKSVDLRPTGLYEYLENRYADTVVLTFGQIEDLLGFSLPDLARTDQEWWTSADLSTTETRCSDAWTLASRTARPNLMAKTVVFERVS
jgi:hypothetical protein